ncbi:hypothetical protein SAMN05428949_6791 [Chitinophaga sp. YR627]|nr:hypothetical protein SAMN05428949_6791 [Chitinophaga sp. YR627]
MVEYDFRKTNNTKARIGITACDGVERHGGRPGIDHQLQKNFRSL